MNFSNLPAQFIILLLGWSFTLYLQYLSNRRAEALKRKDKIVSQLSELASWVNNEVAKRPFKPDLTEEAYTGLILELELRLNHLNEHVRKELVDVSVLGRLRDIDFFNAGDRRDLYYRVKQISSDLIEDIEIGCDAIYFQRSLLHRFNYWIYELKGFLTGILSLIFFVLLVRLVNASFFAQ